MKQKFVARLPGIWDETFPLLGAGLVACFFVASLLCRFEQPGVNLLQWCCVGMFILFVPILALDGSGSEAPAALLPLVVLFAVGGISLLVRRLALAAPEWELALPWLFVALLSLGIVLRIAGPPAAIPYPPYYPPFIAHVCGCLEADESLATDIPWATAWYGNRRSLLLPRSVEELQALHAGPFPVAGVYLTTRTADRPFTSALADGPYRSWLPVLNGSVPEGFPFRHGFILPPGGRTRSS